MFNRSFFISTKYWLIAISSFVIFGFLPIFWSLFAKIDCYTILFHRCLWTFLIALPVVICKFPLKKLINLLVKKWHFLLLSSGAIATNWYTFIYAVNNEHVFEAGLAYFISPLINVLLSAFFLKEIITKRQFIAILIAFIAILYLTITKNIFPRYALLIGSSFSFYGILGRKIDTSPILRLAIEGLITTIVFIFLFQSPKTLYLNFSTFSSTLQILCILSGAVTLVPMFLYIIAAKNLQFSTLGMISYLLPTIVFLVGIFYFKQPIDREKCITIFLIWLSIGIYLSDLLKKRKFINSIK